MRGDARPAERARRSSARCSRTTARSTCSRPRGSSCSARATSGSWSACRSSCARELGWSFWQVGPSGGLGDRLRRRPGRPRRAVARAEAAVEPTAARPRARVLLAAFPAAIAVALGAGRRAACHRRGPDRLRDRVRPELRGALVPDPRLRRGRQGRDERRLLLHGERRRAARRHHLSGALYQWRGLEAALDERLLRPRAPERCRCSSRTTSPARTELPTPA